MRWVHDAIVAATVSGTYCIVYSVGLHGVCWLLTFNDNFEHLYSPKAEIIMHTTRLLILTALQENICSRAWNSGPERLIFIVFRSRTSSFFHFWHARWVCLLPNADINLQSGRFWATSVASFRDRWFDFRSCWIVSIHPRGYEGVLMVSSSSPRGSC